VLFPTCLGDLVAPDSVSAAASVLEACGCLVDGLRGATCCGQPAFNAGFDREARRVARTTVRALGRTAGPIVVPAGSCAAMMRLHWRELFHDDRDETLARAVAGRVVEWSAYLAERVDDLRALAPRWPGRVGYHDSCHLLRELHVKEAPRTLLGAVAGLVLVELPAAERCCGFGGTFAVRYPDVSVAMADSKLEDARRAGIDALVSADGGCLLHLGGRLSRTGAPIRPLHLATLLDEAIRR
jgi:L-lactate dehydrogenase complex protein LldE